MFVYIIDDSGSLVQIGAARTSFAAKIVSYPSLFNFIRGTASNRGNNNKQHSKRLIPINFSIKGGVTAERLIFTNDTEVVATLDIPSPTYTL